MKIVCRCVHAREGLEARAHNFPQRERLKFGKFCFLGVHSLATQLEAVSMHRTSTDVNKKRSSC